MIILLEEEWSLEHLAPSGCYSVSRSKEWSECRPPTALERSLERSVGGF
jgi:hypothetical protein